MKTTCLLCLVAFVSSSVLPSLARADRPVVPGTGTRIDYVGDDFEDTSWDFVQRFPKSSREQDGQLRGPTGFSTNHRWVEGPERGQPDYMKIVPTPPGGLAGSEHALMLRTLNSYIPGVNTYNTEQDDFVANSLARIGTVHASEIPSVVARIYLPPADEWENRTGPHFGFRISTQTTTTKTTSRGLFGSRTTTEAEPYWPGLWIHFRSKGHKGAKEDSAFLTYRGNTRGNDVRCKEIPVEQFGWWTMGMSVTPDGQVHYYAKPGVEDLTQADYITSQFPYGYSAQKYRTFFFNVCNRSDGKTWSTPFVIDDPALYVVNSSRVERIVQNRIEREIRNAERKQRMREQREANRARRSNR